MDIIIRIGFGLLLVILSLCFFWGINGLIYKIYYSRSLYASIKTPPFFKSFSIRNPYKFPGQYYKAQLHLHTSNSIDVPKKEPIPVTIKKYEKAGYRFVVITDHDTVTKFPNYDNCSILVIPGMEKTIPFSFRPYGKHLIRIGGENGIIMPAHPNWRGNLGTGSWYINDLMKLNDFHLIEIYNHHSDSKADLQLWHKLMEKKGYQNPVWGVAVDDSDNGEVIDRGWIMIKTKEFTIESFFNALRQGAFYATTGPNAEFESGFNEIKVVTDPENRIFFINSRNQVLDIQKGMGIYKFSGAEGFIRVEVKSPSGKTAWSQPFYVLPDNG